MALNPDASVQKTYQTPIKNTKKPSAIIIAATGPIIRVIETSTVGIEQIRRSGNIGDWKIKTKGSNQDGSEKYHRTH